MHTAPTVRLFVVTLSVSASVGAGAATVQKINKEQDKFIVEVSQAEMELLEEDEEVLVEVGKDRFTVAGTVTKLDLEKQTALIELPEADERLEKKQTVTFLSLFRNVAASPILQTYGQYHQLSRSFVEGTGGGFGTKRTTKFDGGDVTEEVRGTLLGIEAFGLLYPKTLGIGLAYERRSATVRLKADQEPVEVTPGEVVEDDYDYEETRTSNVLRPGVWYLFMPGWIVSATYDYSMVELGYDAEDARALYDVSTGEPRIGVTSVGEDFQWGLEYKDGAEFETDYLVTTDKSDDVPASTRYKVAPEATAFFRSVSPSLFVWGMRLGYTMFERTADEDGWLGPKPKPAELIRFLTSFEHRLDEFSKFDWGLLYRGAFVTDLEGVAHVYSGGGWSTSAAPRYNAAGLFFTYETLYSTNIFWGGTLSLDGGSRNVDYESDSVSLEQKTSGYGGSLVLHLTRKFDVSMRRHRFQ